MISLDEARARLLACVRPLPAEACALDAALGRHLAEDVVSTRDLPGTDNSAMDGFAVRAEETAGASRASPRSLDVAFSVFAGEPPGRALAVGQAARVFTGATLPLGADAVVRQEATEAHGARVQIFVEARPGEHVRRVGEELRRGQPLLARGARLESVALGLLATIGRARVRVRPRPRVALLTVGDELLEPGSEAQPHQTFDSNAVLLAAMVREAGGEVVAKLRVADEPGALALALPKLLEAADALVTSGGASVGEKDFVKGALKQLGADFAFESVAVKPGKPAAFATLGGKPLVVLPGNPGAASVTFDQLARPALLALQGAREVRRTVRARIDSARQKQPALTYLIAAKLEGDGAVLRPQGSGQILQNLGADGFAILPAGRGAFEAGAEVAVELFCGPRFEPLEER